MRKLVAFVLCALLLTGCTALPGEERSFAVALGIGKQGDVWTAGARIPTYQSGGGYATLMAEGASLGESLAKLSAQAPMELHYGQLRLLALTKQAADSGPIPELLAALAERGEVRPQAAVCVTEEDIKVLLDAMKPATGSRLSKSLEAMVQARQTQGALPESTLSGVVRMGERQQPVLMNAALEGETVQLAGGWMVGGGQLKSSLSSTEMQLLSLLMGRWKQGTIALENNTLTLLDADSSIRLEGGRVHCKVQLRYGASTMTEEGVQQAVAQALRALTAKLADANCDALGLARQAVTAYATMAQWRDANWAGVYPALEWEFAVEAERGA